MSHYSYNLCARFVAPTKPTNKLVNAYLIHPLLLSYPSRCEAGSKPKIWNPIPLFVPFFAPIASCMCLPLHLTYASTTSMPQPFRPTSAIACLTSITRLPPSASISCSSCLSYLHATCFLHLHCTSCYLQVSFAFRSNFFARITCVCDLYCLCLYL